MSVPNLRILIIEDEEEIVRLLTDIFTTSSVAAFSCESANRLSAACGMLDENGFDVIMLDLYLPDSHGLDGLKRMLERYPEYPIVVFTGAFDVGLMSAAITMGAEECLPKPPKDIEELCRSVCKAAIRFKRYRGQDRKISKVSVTSWVAIIGSIIGVLLSALAFLEKFLGIFGG